MAEKKYICITPCDNGNHCIATMAERLKREEECQDYCPCGCEDKWEELENKDCTYCKHGYMYGDELKCSKFNESNNCNDYELDDYFAEEIKKYKFELKENNNNIQ